MGVADNLVFNRLGSSALFSLAGIIRASVDYAIRVFLLIGVCAVTAGAADPTAILDFGRIDLPKGAVFENLTVELPADWKNRLVNSKPQYSASYPSGKLKEVFTYLAGRGLLHGPSATFDQSERLIGLAVYDEGKRTGQFRRWTEDGKPLLYVDYAGGNKHGYLCLFREQQPWLLQHWQGNLPLADCLVVSQGGSYVAITEGKLTPEQKQEWAEAHEQLAALDDTIRDDEALSKNGVYDWYREEAELVKQARASARSSRQRAAAAHQRLRVRAKATEQNRLRLQDALYKASPR